MTLLPDAFAETQRRLVRRIPAGSLDPCGYGSDNFLFAIRHLVVVCTHTCTFRCCIVLRQLYACCMRCCILVAVMLCYHVEIWGIWLRHMSRWVRYVLRPRIWMETSRSRIVPHIGSYTRGAGCLRKHPRCKTRSYVARLIVPAPYEV